MNFNHSDFILLNDLEKSLDNIKYKSKNNINNIKFIFIGSLLSNLYCEWNASINNITSAKKYLSDIVSGMHHVIANPTRII